MVFSLEPETLLINVVEDDHSVRNSIADYLTLKGFKVATWRSAEDFLVDGDIRFPSVVITDMRLPKKTGLELHVILQQRAKCIPIIYVSGQSSVLESVTALKTGAVDFLVKPFSSKDLLDAIQKAVDVCSVHKIQTEREKAFEDGFSILTQREREVLPLLAKGYGNAELMAKLSLSLPTVKQYKGNIMTKLNLTSLVDLIELYTKFEKSFGRRKQF